MKFFALLATIAATATAAAVPEKKESCLAKSFDLLALFKELQEKGEITISGPPDSWDELVNDAKNHLNQRDDLNRRWDVPGLNCGSARALRCAGYTVGPVANCVLAGLYRGLNVIADATCVQAAAAWGAKLPEDCVICFDFGHDNENDEKHGGKTG